jgi:hypothetical protein
MYAPIPWEEDEPREALWPEPPGLPRRDLVLASLASRMREQVEKAASGFEAVVTQAGPTVRLEEPALGDAATLGFTVDSPQQVTCFPGDNGMQFEIWRDDFDQILAGVVELVSAVLDGAYSERVKTDGKPRSPKIVASWPDAAGARRESGLNTFLGILNERNSARQRYRPYRRAA